MTGPEGGSRTTTSPADDARWMRKALGLARRCLGRTSPNPPVGAVLVRDGHLVGRGMHRAAGLPHAEIEAIAEAGPDARGSTLYVTLEPCSTQGRTPPCTGAILRAGVSRVVAAVADPNPRHAGRAFDILRAAGVQAEWGRQKEEAARLIRGFAWWVRTGRPYVVAKAAMSLDGRIASPSGLSRWITGPQARRNAHRDRAWVDAILVGAGTVARDDPALTRRFGGAERCPLRVVLCADEAIPADRRLFSDAHAERTLVACPPAFPEAARRALADRGVSVLDLPPAPGGVDLGALLDALGRREILSVLVEGGAGVFGSLFRGGLVNEGLFHYAPIVMGDGIDAVRASLAPHHPEEAPRMSVVELKRAGEDWIVRGRFPCSPGSSKTWAWWTALPEDPAPPEDPAQPGS